MYYISLQTGVSSLVEKLKGDRAGGRVVALQRQVGVLRCEDRLCRFDFDRRLGHPSAHWIFIRRKILSCTFSNAPRALTSV